MSRENVDRLQEMFDAFNRGEFEAALKEVHPAIALHPAITELDVQTSYHGREEVKQFFETISEAWESYTVEREETIEVPGERLLIVERWRARGRDGIQFDFQLTDLYTFRNGVVIRIDGFANRSAALEAVGLSE
jgi:ketosteroid isomerase-like protein